VRPAVVALGRLPAERAGRRTLRLGRTGDGGEPGPAVRGRNALVAGDPRSGKSWVAGLLAEQLILHRYCVCVLDPAGDYAPLGAPPRVGVLGGEDPPPRPRGIARALRRPDASLVLDLVRLGHAEKREHAATVLPLLAALRRERGLPHRVPLDEAHGFFPPSATPPPGLGLGGHTLVTYRPALPPEAALRACPVLLATRLVDRADATRPLEATGLPGPRGAPAARRAASGSVPASRRACATARSTSTRRSRSGSPSSSSPAALAGYLARGDFARWIAAVFGAHPLASEIAELARRHARGGPADARRAIAEAVRERYAPADTAA
jgi:hypothetical protein